MKPIKFLCRALMIKYTSKTMDMTDWLLANRVNYKRKSYLNNYSKQLLGQAMKISFFFSSQNSFYVNL